MLVHLRIHIVFLVIVILYYTPSVRTKRYKQQICSRTHLLNAEGHIFLYHFLGERGVVPIPYLYNSCQIKIHVI